MPLAVDVNLNPVEVAIDILENEIQVAVNAAAVEVAVQGLGATGPEGEGVPPGGTTGQVLAKVSGTDFDSDWQTIAGTGIVQSIVAGTNVTVDDTDPANPIVSSSGGGGSFPDFTGSGSPEGIQTADVGQSYQDSDTGALYFFDGAPDTDTGWRVGVGGTQALNNGSVPGVGLDSGNKLLLIGAGGQGVIIADQTTQAPSGQGNGIFWLGADTTAHVLMLLGDAAQFEWHWAADGSTSFPGTIGTIGAVPADGDISNGQLWVGFDDTPGACLALLKAKDSAGAVYTATIPMTAA